MTIRLAGCAVAAVLYASASFAQAPAQVQLTLREVPAKVLPVPGTVSPGMQAIIGQPLRANWDKPPTTPEGWKQLADGNAATVAPQVPALAERLRVTVEPTTIDGVRAYTVTPSDMPDANRGRVAVHVHGGCYVPNPREAALPEAMMLAGFGRMRVVAVDHRMPPEAYFPAALDDATTL